jgi:hypothetical protein
VWIGIGHVLQWFALLIFGPKQRPPERMSIREGASLFANYSMVGYSLPSEGYLSEVCKLPIKELLAL